VREVTFHPEAEAELKSATNYYASESEKLSADFRTEIERLVRSIQDNPLAGRLLDAKNRRRLCRRFPFGVIYRLSADEIFIVAVAQQNRKPDYWRSRS
jgi:plasmid stabilization system protein ParE